MNPHSLQRTGKKRARHFGAPRLTIMVTAMLSGLTAPAQFSLDWSTLDGGGGTSGDGRYSLSGTIAQPDGSQPMTGGPYSLTGGFWVLPEIVHTEGAPTLLITKGAPGTVILSWAAAATGWKLQESPDLTSNWTDTPGGETTPVTVPAVPPRKFYRLDRR
jgi:hypothetical protein